MTRQAVPPERLAVLRILTIGFATGYLAIRSPAYYALTDNPESTFEPLGVLSGMSAPVAGWTLGAGLVATVLTGAAATAGWRYRLSGPAFAVLLLLITTYRSSWGQILWFEILVVLHVIVVGLAPAADALSFDDRRRGRPDVRPGPRYGWPILVVSVITVTTYFIAGIAKFRYGGSDWVDGDVLVNHVAFTAARLEVFGAASSPLAVPLVKAPIVASVFAVGAVVLELAAPVALVGGRVRTIWVVSTWLMHTVIALTMFVVFPYPLAGMAFASLFAIEGLPARFSGQ